MSRGSVYLLVVLGALFGGDARAQWTLPRGDLAVVTTYDYTFGNREYLGNRRERRFPLGGEYQASTLTLGARAGITDRIEVELSVPLRLVSYRSSPVILLEPMDLMGSGLDFYQENVLDFDQSRIGVGDVWLTGRYGFYRRHPLALALEGRIKIPTGYDAPQGTFGDDPTSAQDFLDRAGEIAVPGNIRDDVTLGDGQVDLNVNFLLGASFRSRTFVRLDAGYNLRFGAGDQVLASAKAGQQLGDRVLIYGEARFVYSVTEGPLIGVSVAAENPLLPAEAYQGLNNLMLRELRLERDAFDVILGGIIRLTDTAEVNVGYARTLWGRNTLVARTFYVGVGVRTNLLPD